MITLTDEISTFFSLASLQATYWNMYMGVVLAFLAFMANNWERQKQIVMTVLLGGGMFVFFTVNGYQVYVLQERANLHRDAIYEHVLKNKNQIATEFSTIYLNKSRVPSALVVLTLHATIDVSLFALLLLNYRRTSRKSVAP